MRVHRHDSGQSVGAERATELGVRFAAPIAATVDAYATHFAALGIDDALVEEVAESAWNALRTWAPGLADEIAGLADGAGVPLRDLVAVNARTEVLAAGPPVDECSTAVLVPPTGAPVAFQTWDWHAHLVPDAAVWTYRSDAGLTVRTFTELGMLAKIGLNDAGLSVNFNILHHESDTGLGGVPVHAVARRILDEARSVDDAIALARSAPVAASTVITVVAGREAVSIELSPAGVGLVRPDPRGWLVHTNHFLDPALAPGGLVPPTSTTDARYAALSAVSDRTDALDTTALSSLVRGVCGTEGGSPVDARPDPRLPTHAQWSTLLTVRIAPSVGRFEWYAGGPSALLEAPGASYESAELATDPSHDPRTGLAESGVPWSGEETVDAVLAAAAAAARPVAAAHPRERARWLEAIAAGLEAASDELVALADRETALGVERLSGELARGAVNLRYYGATGADGEWFRARSQKIPGPPPVVLCKANLPVGPVAVFGASNFPFQFGVLGHDTASALAAGCPVVTKAHPAHPRLSARLAEVAREALDAAGAPPGTFGCVVGFEAGLALVDSPVIRAVGFTGSQQGGMALVERAWSRPQPIPVYAEMGTVNPVVVTPGAADRVERIADELAGATTLGAGQFCTKPGLVLAPRGAEVPDALARRIAATTRVWLLTAGIAAAYQSGLADLQAAGATVLAQAAGAGDGFAATPTVLTADVGALKPGSRLLEECFGPVTVVVEYDTVDQALAVLRDLQPSLAASVFGGADDTDLAAIVEQLAAQVGRVVVDGATNGVACVDAMHHGGPWPSTSSPQSTSVGADALLRFTRPVAFQNVPEHALPASLRDPR